MRRHGCDGRRYGCDRTKCNSDYLTTDDRGQQGCNSNYVTALVNTGISYARINWIRESETLLMVRELSKTVPKSGDRQQGCDSNYMMTHYLLQHSLCAQF